MNTEQQGVSIDIKQENNKVYLSLIMHGTLSHDDYQVITPLLESVLKGIAEPKIDMLVDITQLEGWTLHAAWDDLQLGLRHGREFEKIAIIGNKNWQQMLSKVASWFIAGEVKCFNNKEPAKSWLYS